MADALRRLKHRRRVEQGLKLLGVGILDALGQRRDDRLADRQIARRGERHDALARHTEDVKLAEGRDIVEAGIGARVGNHDKAVAHQNPATIGHVDYSPPLLARGV